VRRRHRHVADGGKASPNGDKCLLKEMASFHFSAQVLKRSQGHSAVAAAAYRARGKLYDERVGETRDYSRKAGFFHAEILLPEGAAPFLGDREQLWNYVERIETRRDAQLAREINMALPHELTDAERLQLVRDFARDQFVSRGMVVDFAIHHPVPGMNGDQRNYHAHLMLTLRKATPHGLYRVKTREWNSDEALLGWRAAWADFQNRALERGKHRDRVDHRRLEIQRDEAVRRGDLTLAEILSRKPEIHVGPRAAAAAGQGRKPESKVRTARPRKQPKLRPGVQRQLAKRQVRYPAIDKGSRPSWNAILVELDRQRIRELVERREQQLARFRRHEARLRLTVRKIDRHLLVSPRIKLILGHPAKTILAQRAFTEARLLMVWRLIATLEQTVARLLTIQRTRTDRQWALIRSFELRRERWLPVDWR